MIDDDDVVAVVTEIISAKKLRLENISRRIHLTTERIHLRRNGVKSDTSRNWVNSRERERDGCK